MQFEVDLKSKLLKELGEDLKSSGIDELFII